MVLLLAGAPAEASHPPRGSTWSEAYLSSRDGTALHADVFRPEGVGEGERTPVLLVVSPYLGLPTSDDPGMPRVLDYYRRLYEEAITRRYSIVQVSLRGTGASQGCTDFGGPGDQADVAGAVAWAAARPWSTGSVGMIGHSYDGLAAVIALGQRHSALTGVVVMAPAIDQYRAVFMNGVEYLQGRAIAPYYQAFGVLPPLTELPQTLSGLSGRDPSCAQTVIAEAENRDPTTPFWRERDHSRRAAGSRVPVLWTHGFLDGRDDYSATRPDNFLDVWSRLEGPRRAWFGQFPHVVPGEPNTFGEPEPIGRHNFTGEALDWLDAHVAGSALARARVDRAPAVTVQEGSRGEWRTEPQWPPRGAGLYALPLQPGTYSDAPGNKAEQGDDEGGSCASGVHARCSPTSRTGQGTWTFSQPLSADKHLTGVTRLRASVTAAPSARLIALVYDIDRSNRATLLTRGASLVGEDGKVDFGLYPQDWLVRAGHRIGLLLAGSDDFYFGPGDTGTTVSVEGGSLTLPLHRSQRPGTIGGDPSRAVAERTSFAVDPGTVEERTSALAPPPAASTVPLVVKVKPRRVRARRLVRLRVTVLTRDGRHVAGARVRVGRRLLRTSRDGTLRVRVRFFRTGKRVLRASARGHGRARGWVRVRR